MAEDQHKSALNAAFEAAVAAAYARGFEEGSAATVARIMDAAAASLSPAAPDSPAVMTPQVVSRVFGKPSSDDGFRAIARRAPKGLTQQVLSRVFAHGIRLDEAEVQRRAVEIDRRVNPKTVSNDLRRKPDLYDLDPLNRWGLKAQDDFDALNNPQQQEAPV